MSKLDKALEYLWQQIRAGKEYPDAHTDACEQFKLSAYEGSKLQMKYNG
jgi:hypothetical protein